MVYRCDGTRKQLRKAIGCRAWLNGKEVTKDCFYADPRRGVIRRYKRNAEGHIYIERPFFEHWNVPKHLRPEIAKEELRGRVVVRQKHG